MGEWEDELPPLIREKLARIGEPSAEEKARMKDIDSLNSVLAQFYKGVLGSEGLYERLKQYESQGKQFLLKEAQLKLKGSFKGKRPPVRFKEKDDGKLTVEFAKEGEEEDLVLELTPDNLDETIEKYPLLVVDCWAEWCAPCRMVAPVIEELAEDYRGRITFGKLNVDRYPSLAMRYQIMSIPALLIFKEGQLVDQKVGARPRQVLEPELAKYIQEGT